MSEDGGSGRPLGFPHTGSRIRFGRACERARRKAKLCERVKHKLINASGSGIHLSSFSPSSFCANGTCCVTWVLSK